MGNSIQSRVFPYIEPTYESIEDLNSKSGYDCLNFNEHIVATVADVEGGSRNGFLAVCTHGNAEDILSFTGLMREILKNTGVIDKVVCWEYAGYGMRHAEKPSEKAIEDDARVVAKELKTLFPRKEIIFVGRSLGTYAALVTASHALQMGYRPKAVILLSPLVSIIATQLWIQKPFRRLFSILDGFFNTPLSREMDDCGIPVLILHGDRDKVVPWSNGKELAEGCRHCSFVTIEGRGHNNLSQKSVFINNTIGEFLTPLLTFETQM